VTAAEQLTGALAEQCAEIDVDVAWGEFSKVVQLMVVRRLQRERARQRSTQEKEVTAD
jgi:hypothetical protein